MASRASGAIGWENNDPWPNLQCSSWRLASCQLCSMPSASVSMPSVRPNWTRLWTELTASGESPIAATNDRSILMASIGNVAKTGQGGIAGARVVDRDEHAKLLERAKPAEHRLHVLCQALLGRH